MAATAMLAGMALGSCDKKEDPLPEEKPEPEPGKPGLSSEKAITSFAFYRGSNDGIDSDWGEIDNNAHTVTVRVGAENTIDTVIPDDFAKSLCPYILVSGDATISPKSNEPQDFTKPVKYTVTAADGSTAVYTVTVWLDNSYLEAINSQLKELGYGGSEMPARIPGLGEFPGEMEGHWFELPEGVSYAGQIRGRSGFGDSFYGIGMDAMLGSGHNVMVDIPLYFESGEPFAFELPAGLMIVPINDYNNFDQPKAMTRATTSGKKRNQKPPGGFGNSKTGKALDCRIKEMLGMSCDEEGDSDTKKDPGQQSGLNIQKENNRNLPLQPYEPRSYPASLRSASTIEDAIDPSLDPKKVYILSLALYCINSHGGSSSTGVSYYPLIVSGSPLINWFLKLLEDEEIMTQRIQSLLWKLTDVEPGKFNDVEMNYLKQLAGK
ncbi:hypothetical protein FACS1894181_06180 [Bacteroidia bacterium]|nr:hypothetical protein FACS1894181_06180 [Bacteroidia bacterium]